MQSQPPAHPLQDYAHLDPFMIPGIMNPTAGQCP
jgi:hypothetical protein